MMTIGLLFSRNPFIFCILLVLGTTTGAKAGWTDRCKAALSKLPAIEWSPTTKYTYNDWKSAYEKAASENKTLPAAFALANMAHLKESELGLSWLGKQVLKRYIAALERPWMLAHYMIAPDDNLVVPGTNSLSQKYSRKQRLGNIALTFLDDLIWSSLPFGYRAIPTWFAQAFAGQLADDFYNKVLTNLESQLILGIPNDDFFATVIASHFSSAQQTRYALQQKYFGLIFRPLMISVYSGLIGMATGFDPHPLHYLASNQTPIYSEEEFLADSQQHTQTPFAGRRVSFISDRMFMAGTSANPLMQEELANFDSAEFRQIQEIREKAAHFQSFRFSTIAELNQALEQSRDADIVIIQGHGSPGSIVAGTPGNYLRLTENIDQITPHALKDGAVLVFFSCSFAERRATWDIDEEHEPWIELSRRILGSEGTAVASTAIVSFIPEPTGDENRESRQAIRNLRLIQYPLDFMKTLFIGPEREVNFILDSQTRVYSRSGRAGLRVLDVETGEIRYFPNED